MQATTLDMTPTDIAVHDDTLRIRWQDGSETSLSVATLRRACRCAFCEKDRREGREPVVADGLRIREIRLVADKAMNPVFSDGHERGIYPWDYVRML
ncbi:DUF971 domain-containing protein [Uliginosibacterium sp. H1]|uniref:DUF971 domain-containing protein n=1 Tax=Uliginosibacterium sp. H1 TaxID=3114757 RepID=UPI002E190162|nr:DUF971 domain-containing protein [Uliginosibacterium sp. H1]